MTRRDCLTGAAAPLGGTAGVPVAPPASASPHSVCDQEDAFCLHDPRSPIDQSHPTWPNTLPRYEYSRKSILELMLRKGIDTPAIRRSYYGRDNSHATPCGKQGPAKFGAIWQLIGYQLYSHDNRENPSRFACAIKPEYIIGMRLVALILDQDVVWTNKTVCGPLHKKKERPSARPDVFLESRDICRMSDLAERVRMAYAVVDYFTMLDIARSAAGHRVTPRDHPNPNEALLISRPQTKINHRIRL